MEEVPRSIDSVWRWSLTSCSILFLVSYCYFVETSSKHGVGVEEAFHELCQNIVSRLRSGDIKIRFVNKNCIKIVEIYISVTRLMLSKLGKNTEAAQYVGLKIRERRGTVAAFN